MQRLPSTYPPGVSTLLGPECAAKLDAQEAGYALEVCPGLMYDRKTELDVEVGSHTRLVHLHLRLYACTHAAGV